MLFDPSPVTKKLPYNSVIPARYLKLDHHEISLCVQSEYVDEAPSGRKLNAGNAFVLVELETRLNMR